MSKAILIGLLTLFQLVGCAHDRDYVDTSKFIRLEDREREPIPALVSDAKARLMEPYILAGEDVGSLILRTEIALRQNTDQEVLREFQQVGPDCGYLYYFLQNSPIEAERRASIAFIEANKPPKSQLPAFNVQP